MDEEVFNMEVRRFLKHVGVTSQREIESAVHTAIATGRLKGDERVKARMVLVVGAAGLEKEIDGEIALG